MDPHDWLYIDTFKNVEREWSKLTDSQAEVYREEVKTITHRFTLVLETPLMLVFLMKTTFGTNDPIFVIHKSLLEGDYE